MSRSRSPWRRLDAHLLTHWPELWLMRIHWIAAASALACAAAAALGLLWPLSLTEYPDLTSPQWIAFYLALLLAGVWAWRYLSRTSGAHVSLQRRAPWLTASHMACLCMILLPTQVLPAALLARFDRLPSGTLEEDMLAHLEACACVNSFEPKVTLESPEVLRFGVAACHVWLDRFVVRDREHACHSDEQVALRASQRLVDIGARYGLSADPADVSRVARFDAGRLSSRETRHMHTFLPWGPEPLPGLRRLWHAWCYRVSEGERLCRLPDLDALERPKNEAIGDLARVVVRGREQHGQVALFGLVTAYLALALTCVRLGAARRFLWAFGWLIALDILIFNVFRLFGASRAHEYVLLITYGVSVVYVGSLLVVALGERLTVPGSRTRWPFKLAAGLGCATAPIVPLMWCFGQRSAVFEDGVVDLVLSLPETSIVRSDLPVDWLIFGGAVSTSLLAAWVAVDMWRRAGITPAD